MKLKYYLRGLGIGILITTIILSIALKVKKESLTDAEIIERATDLGMVQQEEDVEDIADSEINSEDNAESDLESSDSSSDSANDTEEVKKQETQEIADDATVEAEEEEVKEKEKETQQIELVEVMISGGQSSDAVAKAIHDAKLVDDSEAFNRFLIDNKYDEHLQVGTFSIPKGATFEEIAEILIK